MKPDIKKIIAKYHQLILVFTAVLAVAIVLIATSTYGSGISRDSVG